MNQVGLVGDVLQTDADAVLTIASERATGANVERCKSGCSADWDPLITKVADGI